MGRLFRSILKIFQVFRRSDDEFLPDTASTGLLWLSPSPLSSQAQDPASTGPFWWAYDRFPTDYDLFRPIRPSDGRSTRSLLKILAVSASLKPVQACSCGSVVTRLILLVGASLEPILNCRPVSHCIVGRLFHSESSRACHCRWSLLVPCLFHSFRIYIPNLPVYVCGR